MELKLKTNVKKFEEEISFWQKLKNKIGLKKAKKQIKKDKQRKDDTKMFTETLIVDEILEE